MVLHGVHELATEQEAAALLAGDVSRPALVLVYSTWCPHCRPVMAAIETAATRMEGVSFARLDCERARGLMPSQRIHALPTMLTVDCQGQLNKYSGARTAVAIVAAAQALL
jgi:thioredoxin-like negative regulator of GroEL